MAVVVVVVDESERIGKNTHAAKYANGKSRHHVSTRDRHQVSNRHEILPVRNPHTLSRAPAHSTHWFRFNVKREMKWIREWQTNCSRCYTYSVIFCLCVGVAAAAAVVVGCMRCHGCVCLSQKSQMRAVHFEWANRKGKEMNSSQTKTTKTISPFVAERVMKVCNVLALASTSTQSRNLSVLALIWYLQRWMWERLVWFGCVRATNTIFLRYSSLLSSSS